MEYIQKIKSPIGLLTVASDGKNISGLWIEGQKYFARTLEKETCEKTLPVFDDLRKWLDVYFSGKAPGFLPPLAPKGTPFQQSVWKNLCKIPYGKTLTYGGIAALITGRENTSARAVGGAVGHNPISILVPCHRVIGQNGSLTGYAGGMDVKEKLLRLEGIMGGPDA
ncbi:methylated-DNA--protein-cysteine methyltransferase [Spirochaetia bacterium]|nr:methylated-DNA--protein-cysteine methyltransferase [Spirochaetia bacterium]